MSAGRDLIERRARELIEGLGALVYDEASKARVIAALLADPELMAAADALREEQFAQVDEAIEDAKLFYVGTDGRRHRITDMANGHLHNAVARLKRIRLGGVWAFTILAMDAEIARREKETPHG
jgi:hypothetical protein